MFILSKKAASSIAAAVAGKVRLFITDTGKIATKDEAGTVINYATSTDLSDGLSGKLSNANSGVTAGSYGGTSSIPVLAINSKGQVTSASTVAVAGGGGSSMTWVDLTVLTANGFASGFATGTINKLQIAKDTDGYVWIRGVIRNTSASTNSNTLAVLPTAYMVRVQNTSVSVASTALTADLNANGVTSNLGTSYFDASTQVLGKQGGWSANGVYFITPAILGIALNP